MKPKKTPPAETALASGLDRVGARVNLVSALTQSLRREILEGRLRPGDRLPTELALGASAGVSRTVVREATASLKAEGLVETRQGSGAFVLPPGARRQRQPEIATVEDILEMLELRAAVEVEAAALAARRRDENDLVQLTHCFEQFVMARAQGLDTSSADLAFHHALSVATHNARFVSFLHHLGEFAIPRGRLNAEYPGKTILADHLELIEKEHRAILNAVLAADPQRAAAQMREHLGGSRARYAAFIEQSLQEATVPAPVPKQARRA